MQRGAFAAPTLHAALTEMSDRRDRALVTDLTYGVLRHGIRLQAALEPLLRAPERLPPRVFTALQLAAFEILVREAPRFAAVNEWVSIVKRRDPGLAGLVNAVLRRLRAPEGLSAAASHSLPEWLWQELQDSLGDHAAAAAAGMLEPEPLWLAALQPQAEEILRVEDNEVWPGPVSGSLGARLAWPLADLESFTAGLVQPMNPASLLVARLTGAADGERVLDLASGNGIKAAVMAAAGADVTSVEIDPAKLWRARQNQRRLQLRVRHVEADLTRVPDGLEPAPLVLLDAPCTGTGTLRGNPEIKLRLEPEAIGAAAALQQQMLQVAAQLTAPGGTLVYAVCSLSRAEGPEQVAKFLAANPQFEAVDAAAAAAPHLADSAATDALLPSAVGTWILPLRGLDGFFVAVLKRSN